MPLPSGTGYRVWKHIDVLPYIDYDIGKGQMGDRFFNQMENGKEEILLINYKKSVLTCPLFLDQPQ
jgi:hypothetical protein